MTHFLNIVRKNVNAILERPAGAKRNRGSQQERFLSGFFGLMNSFSQKEHAQDRGEI